jgi:hypothetical protein
MTCISGFYYCEREQQKHVYFWALPCGRAGFYRGSSSSSSPIVLYLIGGVWGHQLRLEVTLALAFPFPFFTFIRRGGGLLPLPRFEALALG